MWGTDMTQTITIREGRANVQQMSPSHPDALPGRTQTKPKSSMLPSVMGGCTGAIFLQTGHVFF
jgi:hypothetical protein